GVIFEATHDRRVDLDATIVVSGSSDKRADLREFLDALIAFDFAGLNVAKHGLDRSLFKASAFGEVAAFVETPLAEQEANAFRTKLVELVDSPQHGEAAASIFCTAKADGFEHTVENLAVVDADDV